MKSNTWRLWPLASTLWLLGTLSKNDIRGESEGTKGEDREEANNNLSWAIRVEMEKEETLEDGEINSNQTEEVKEGEECQIKDPNNIAIVVATYHISVDPLTNDIACNSDTECKDRLEKEDRK
ncbi:hypothetical protein HAX54_020101 [Datura stramonium]|uniref:Uncharacterized protein n=1 Tax=Datura stramonium TaxID=4076 RepID=A0ABS8Y770_DATST|nr:hypothetical protein [Datura stramonium]